MNSNKWQLKCVNDLKIDLNANNTLQKRLYLPNLKNPFFKIKILT
jgi:hypothetical protein